MKLKLRELKKALNTLEWKTGWDSGNRFDDGMIDIVSSEEDVASGVLCASIKISVSYQGSEDKFNKQITKSIELYPNDESRAPVITKVETYSLEEPKED